MSRRNERRNEDIMAALLVGMGLLRNLAGRSRRAERPFVRAARRAGVERRSGSWGSVAMMVFMVGAFIVLGLFMALVASIVALAQSPAAAMLCAMPLATVAFLIWAVRRNGGVSQSRNTAGESHSTPAGQFNWEHTVGTGESGAARELNPASMAQQAPAAYRERTLAEEYPEKGMRPPSEYRQRAASYRRRIESLLKKRRPGALADRIRGVLQKLKSWEERVGQLADRLALFETDDLIQRDLREVPGHIDRLKRQIMLEGDPEMRRQIGRTLGAYEEQLRQLRLLARVMRRTRFNLDDTLAAMGTVYSQVQVLNAMDIDAPVAARIDDEIGREVERLNDLMAALSDVYASSNGSGEEVPVAGSSDDEDDAGLSRRSSRLGRSTAG
jgi:hypothetical protein